MEMEEMEGWEEKNWEREEEKLESWTEVITSLPYSICNSDP